ncbi:putative DCG1 protein [Metarhizium acridum CQMa 102]|uniref:Putative DCG1 protein n=1 Tax=Metarhizium acridum (strain CQMa 102) TaxID=655827 RepID=E9DZ48_METAQ|nr:putative DCG1 protein [Metarhizium acridum CQMa 102]EFY91010.1 putative DCG1 protein [Metarhizium acridum CQMa 102]
MKILLLNPNSSATMTKSMELVAKSALATTTINVVSYTAPEAAPISINNDKDIACSTVAVMDHIFATQTNLQQYDAVLIACFSVHDLVHKLGALTGKPIIGLFEASILTALSLISKSEKWGIVTTGEFWEQHLRDGVNDFLGVARGVGNNNFAGVYSTGLSAIEFHRASEEVIQSKLATAVTRLLESGDVKCVVLGCGGMTGLEQTIQSVAAKVLGHEKATRLYIVDGVRAGVAQLYFAATTRGMFRRDDGVAI